MLIFTSILSPHKLFWISSKIKTTLDSRRSRTWINLYGKLTFDKHHLGRVFQSFNPIIIINPPMTFFEKILQHPAYASTDIVTKCKKYQEFHLQLYQMDIQYAHDLNMAIYAGLQDVESMGVFHITQKPVLTVSFFAYLMPPYETYASKFYLLWIKMLDELLRQNYGRKYSIIYYHTLCQSNYPYQFLSTIFKKLPIYYYAMLDTLYTVNCTFFVRKSASLFDFSRLNKLFERKMEHIEKISQFAQIGAVNQMGVLEELPPRLMTQLQIKTQKKLMKNQKEKLPQKPIKAYQMPSPKKIVSDCLTIPLTKHIRDKDGIPVPLSILLETLKTHQKFLQLQGIFRKSGSIEQEQEIIQQLGKMTAGDQLKNIDEYSGYAVAGVVKKFLTKLSTPIVPYPLYTKLLSILSETQIKPQQEVSFILDFLHELPPINRKILLHMMTFLRKEVTVRSQKNKMNEYNTSVCFFPCFFRSQNQTLADLMNSGKFVGVLNVFFKRYDEVMVMQERSSSGSEGEKGSRPVSSFKHFRVSMA